MKPMKTLELLQQSTQRELTPEEESLLLSELSAAYHSDEASIESQDVQRIAEKITAKMNAK